MILVLNFDKNPLYSSCEGIVNSEISLYQEIIYEVGYSLSDLSDENVEDKSQLILGLLGKENDVFEAINSHITMIVNKLVSENPTGEHEIVFPPRYIDWLRYNVNPAYHSIAEGLEKSNGKLEMSIDELYDQTISDNVVRKTKDIINQHKDIDTIVVSGVKVSDNSQFIKSITDNNSSVKVVDDNYEPLLQSLVLKYSNQRDYETVISLLKKIDTFDSWLMILVHKINQDANDIKDCIQQVKLKATNSREKDIISEIAKAWDIRNDNKLPSFDITLMQWLKYISDENNPINLSYYIAGSRLDNIDEAIIWYKNSGDEGRIKEAYIYSDKAKEAVVKLHNLQDVKDFEPTTNEIWTEVCNARAVCNSFSIENKHIEYILALCSLAVMEKNYAYLKRKSVPGCLVGDYKTTDDLVALSNRVYNRCVGNYERALALGGTMEEFPDIRQEIKKLCDNYVQYIEEYNERIRVFNLKVKNKLEGKLDVIFVPGGEFLMGEGSTNHNEYKHKVTISPFMMMPEHFNSTLARACMGYDDNDKKYYKYNYEEIEDYIKSIREATGLEFSLMTEAQYEYLYKICQNKEMENFLEMQTRKIVAPDDNTDKFFYTSFRVKEDTLCLDDYDYYPNTEQMDPVTIIGGSYIKVLRSKMERSKAIYYNGDDSYPESGYCRLVRKPTEEELQWYEQWREKDLQEAEEKRNKNEQLDAQYVEAYKKLSEYEAFLDANQGSSYDYVEDVEQINRVMPYLTFLHDNGWVRSRVNTDSEQYAGIMAYLKICHYDKIPLDWHEDIFNLLYIYSPKYIHRVYTEAKIIFAYCEVFGIHCPIDNQSALDSSLESSLKKTIPSLTDRQEIKKQKEMCLYGNDQKQLDDRKIKYMQNVGSRFMTGDKEAGIPHNPRFAFVLLEKAALDGDKEAIKLLSKCYREGIGTIKDEAKADELYKEEIRKIETSEINNTSSKGGFLGRLFGKKK